MQCFRTAPLQREGIPQHPPLAPYLKAGTALPSKIVQDMSKFRLSSHSLRIHTGRQLGLAYADRACDRCVMGVVDDETRLLLECSETATFRELPEFDSLPLQRDLRTLFRDGDACLVAQYVSKCMSVLENDDAGKGRSAT